MRIYGSTLLCQFYVKRQRQIKSKSKFEQVVSTRKLRCSFGTFTSSLGGFIC